jgi:hypothetical protein
MTQLAVLRSRLQSLRFARTVVRWGSALAVFAVGVLALWAVAFLLDRLLLGNRAVRGVVLLGWFAAVIGLIRSLIVPLFRPAESLEQLALWVERQHQLDGDLVSALQFESPAARTWGSPRLTSAVVDYVAEFSRGLDVYSGFTWEPLPQRLVAAVGALVVTAGLVFAFPTHAGVFWNRFWLGAARYPTRTVLAELWINGEPVAPFHGEPLSIAVPQDRPLSVQVRLEGELPAEATAIVRGLRSGQRGQWPLASTTEAVYGTEQRQLVESLRLWIRAGDAESDPVDLAVVPLPVIDVRWTVRPPAYARQTQAPTVPSGARSFSVLQGSQLTLQVTGVNKPLESVSLIVNGPEPVESSLLSDAPHEWRSPPGTALDSIQQALTYELRVTDADGLSPQPPIAGEIRLQTDRIPRVVAAAISRKVLPLAQPRVSYGASDDFGVGVIRLEWEVIPVEGARRSGSQVIRRRDETSPVQVVRGETPFDLRPLQLAVGDEVRIILAADDVRGEFAPQVGRSEPLVLQVTDKQGILQSLLEIDQQSAQQLDAIIEKELGIGGPSR